MMSDKKYVYDLKQAYFYIQHGVLPIEEPQVHCKTKRVFFVFGYNDTKEVYSKWLDACEEHRKNLSNISH